MSPRYVSATICSATKVHANASHSDRPGRLTVPHYPKVQRSQQRNPERRQCRDVSSQEPVGHAVRAGSIAIHCIGLSRWSSPRCAEARNTSSLRPVGPGRAADEYGVDQAGQFGIGAGPRLAVVPTCVPFRKNVPENLPETCNASGGSPGPISGASSSLFTQINRSCGSTEPVVSAGNRLR